MSEQAATDHQTARLTLGLPSFAYADLYNVQRLTDLAAAFDDFLRAESEELFLRFDTYRSAMRAGAQGGGLDSPVESDLLVSVSRPLSRFLLELFGATSEALLLRHRAARDAEVASFKKEFVSRRVAKIQDPALSTEEARRIDDTLDHLVAAAGSGDREHAFARLVLSLLAAEKDPAAASEDLLRTLAIEAQSARELLDRLARWAALRWISPSERWSFHGWSSFEFPRPLHFDKLVDTETASMSGVAVLVGRPQEYRRRDGFSLTDERHDFRHISDEANYCLYCQVRKKDSCATGLWEKDGSVKRSLLALPLSGCPLNQRIGEMNLLRAEGDSVASLAIVMIDNPMCPGTGHRICNDCMRSCIFQKQEPVDIPQIETGVLTDVLFLPWGFEIYSLLTRWNPLRIDTPVMRSYNGKNVLIVGLGPAGYTLTHFLAHEGFGVVAIDGLKIEPLPVALTGDDTHLPEPIRDLQALWEDLDDRLLAGFGGVSEYGITARWDKNFLKCVRIALERKRNVRFYGGIRFGGTITIDDAFERLGFDHIAIAAGAGTPTIVRMKNNLVRGIRKASDFLMALQLTGAFKKTSLANLQVRLPAVVIGGGLTAIDTATELFAYYPVHVEKTLSRYEVLCDELGEALVRSGYDAEELGVLDEFLGHGRAVRDERQRALRAGEKPDFIPLVRAWGGVTVVYRKSLTDSPAYRLNYEEVAKALEEGIGYLESFSPVEALTDERGQLQSIRFSRQVLEDDRWRDSDESIDLPARSAMVAAGTAPNIIYEKEHPGTFALDNRGEFFQAYRCKPATESEGARCNFELVEGELGFFTSYRHPADPKKMISFYGDNHPHYAGNVVKAMASAKDGYPHVVSLFATDLKALDSSALAQRQRDARWKDLCTKIDDALLAEVVAVNRLTPTIVEVVVRAPYAAERFHPGQFYRLQNYEWTATDVDGTKLMMEGLALTGASSDPVRGLLSLIILELGGSSRLCATLRPGERVVVMGPTGAPTQIGTNETVLLAGGGLGNAVLFSIARAFQSAGSKVLYFAGYKKKEDLFKRQEIEAATDQVIWSVDAGEPIEALRPCDRVFAGNIIQAMLAYATGSIDELPRNRDVTSPRIPLSAVDRILAIGSDGMMRAVRDARRGVLAPHIRPDHIGLGSINSPMQCMMKQVCAQCLQRHVDPVTGKESFVFSCFDQDQHLDAVDFDHLRSRLRQNTVEEKLTNLWVTRLLARGDVARV